MRLKSRNEKACCISKKKFKLPLHKETEIARFFKFNCFLKIIRDNALALASARSPQQT